MYRIPVHSAFLIYMEGQTLETKNPIPQKLEKRIFGEYTYEEEVET